MILQNPAWGFDIESTGVNVLHDRIVTFSLVQVAPSGEVLQKLRWLLDPGVEIPEEAAAIHGIATEHVKEHGEKPAAALCAIASKLAGLIGRSTPLCVYNAPFDCTMLRSELQRYGIGYGFLDDILPIDPLVLDKYLDKFRKGSRKLADVAAFYNVPLGDSEAHDSCFDAVAAVRVAQAMFARDLTLQAMPVPVLVQLQAKWHREQMDSFELYLIRTNSSRTVEHGWPFRDTEAK